MSETIDASSVLGDRAFGFCHDPKYPLLVDEVDWCPLLPVDDAACPAFRTACTGPLGVLDGSPGPQSRRAPGDGDSAPPVRGPAESARTAQPPHQPESSAPAPLAHVLMWVIVGVMVVALVTQLRGPTGTRRADEPAPDEPRPDEPVPEPTAIETDADRLLARAVARAERGELAAAVTDGHAALLRRLADRGHVRLLASRTNGDHLRDLGAEPTLREPTAKVVRVAERVQFGHAAPSRAEVDGLLAVVRQVLGTLASVLLVVWTSLACTSHGTATYPWSHSPSGTAGVLSLVRGHGIAIRYRTTLVADLRADGPTPIVVGRAELTEGEQDVLLDHVRRGGRAIFAGTQDVPAALRIGDARREPGPLLDAAPTGLTLAIPGDFGLIAGDPAARVLWADRHGIPWAVAQPLDRGTVVVLADERLLTNAALAVPDNGAVLLALLRVVDDDFELVDGGVRSVSGEGASDPFDAIERAHLTPVILQLLAFVLLLYLWRGAHFGRPRDPPAAGRRRFGEHVEALGEHYLRAGARRHSLRLYAGWALERIQARFDPQRRGLHHLAGRIAARTDGDETEIMRTLVEAHHARDDDQDAHGSDEDLRVIRELGRLVDTTRGPR